MAVFCSTPTVLTPSISISACALRLPLEIQLFAILLGPNVFPAGWLIPGVNIARSNTPRPTSGRSLMEVLSRFCPVTASSVESTGGCPVTSMVSRAAPTCSDTLRVRF